MALRHVLLLTFLAAFALSLSAASALPSHRGSASNRRALGSKASKPAGYVKAESPKIQVTAEMRAKAVSIAKEAFEKAKKEAKDPENQKKVAIAAAKKIGKTALNALLPGSGHVIDAVQAAKFFKENFWPIIKAELQKLADEAAAESQKNYQAIKTPPQTPKGKKGGK
ncbi:unnamed protein product [Closterium sp. NIES-53]